MVIGLNIDDWLCRNSDIYICNTDCEHCTDELCEDRLTQYGQNEERIKQERKRDFSAFNGRFKRQGNSRKRGC